MSNLTSHGVKMVLPTLIKGFNATAWRTKRAAIMMLGVSGSQVSGVRFHPLVVSPSGFTQRVPYLTNTLCG